MPATTGPSHGRQSLSQLLAVRSNARNGANALQWAIPLAIFGRKGYPYPRGRPAGFQGLSVAHSTWGATIARWVPPQAQHWGGPEEKWQSSC